jgi:DNA-directed RNA polymerase specialized sigma subunit
VPIFRTSGVCGPSSSQALFVFRRPMPGRKGIHMKFKKTETKKRGTYEHYYLTGVDGKKYEVSEEIFRDYKRSVWNEKAKIKRERSVIRDKDEIKSELDKKEHVKVVSVEAIIAGGGEHHLGVIPDFAEEIAHAMEEKELLQILGEALEILDESEKEMVERLYSENITEREYERRYGTPRKTVAYKRDKLLRKLKDFINNKR